MLYLLAGDISSRTLSTQTEVIPRNSGFPVLKVDIDFNDPSYQQATEKGMQSIQQLNKIMSVLAVGGK